MAYRYEKTVTGTDLVIDGGETGVAPSPHKGFANIQNANISTELNEVMASYGRVRQTQNSAGISGSFTRFNGGELIASSGNNSVIAGTWITVANSNDGALPNGDYFVLASFIQGGFWCVELATHYNGAVVTGYGSNLSATFATKTGTNMGQPIASAIESYSNGTQQYRYYVLDANGLVWVYDTAAVNVGNGYYWFLPDFSVGYFSAPNPTGLAVLNGWLLVFAGYQIYAKSTVNLGGTTSTTTTYVAVAQGGRNYFMLGTATVSNSHFAYVGHQGKCYYTDGNYLGSIFPDTSVLTAGANIQSFCSYTAITTSGTIATTISGSLPTSGVIAGETGFYRIPAVFFTDQAGTQPGNLTAGTVYYIELNPNNNSFGVYSAKTGGSAINIASAAVGNQYFNTFFPTSSDATGANATVFYTPQRLNLPTFETATCMVEIGNLVLVGGQGNIIYPWNQVSPTPLDLISLPENNTVKLINVNNMAYAFVGNRGNIYITNGSVASLVLKVPDYCAGIPGTPSTYVEPYFVWGDAMYLRGRVYFSILDQTAAKAGNCGGVWSFVPTQNLYIGQDTGQALRLENQNSYGTYSGVATVLIPAQTQNANSPQYWAGWYSSLSSPAYGIDGTQTFPTSAVVFETDLVPTGTMLDKKTDAQIEYKMSTPLASGETVGIEFRLNGMGVYTSCGTVNTESATDLAGYFSANFEKGQWVQFRVTLTPLFSTATSFTRWREMRLR